MHQVPPGSSVFPIYSEFFISELFLHIFEWDNLLHFFNGTIFCTFLNGAIFCTFLNVTIFAHFLMGQFFAHSFDSFNFCLNNHISNGVMCDLKNFILCDLDRTRCQFEERWQTIITSCVQNGGAKVLTGCDLTQGRAARRKPKVIFCAFFNCSAGKRDYRRWLDVDREKPKMKSDIVQACETQV